MSQEYVFEFYGTKTFELFGPFIQQLLSKFQNLLYQQRVVKFVDNEIHFGVERAGHSGGFWFIPRTQTE